MNLCEIWLFAIVEVFLKQPEIIIIGFGENDVLCPKYIDINEYRGGAGGT